MPLKNLTIALLICFLWPHSSPSRTISEGRGVDYLDSIETITKPVKALKTPEIKPQVELAVVEPPKPVVIAPSGCVTGVTVPDYALNQLIQHESSGNSCSTNSLGCFGLLQACAGAPLREACGGNVACQLDWFTRIKLPKYGSWDAAWAFWQRTDPRPYSGHWW